MVELAEPVGLVLMDDDPGIVELLRDTCPEYYQVVVAAGTCGDIRGVMDQIISFQGILVAVLDQVLPDGLGEEIAWEIKEVRADALVVSFSGYLRSWGDANFQKGKQIFAFWDNIHELLLQAKKCREIVRTS